MRKHFDVIVVGGGIVGAATIFHLAESGVTNTLLVERGRVAGGGTGRSCAIVRRHYSIPSNTALANGSLKMLKDLAHVVDDPEASSGFNETGYLILAPEGLPAEALARNVLAHSEQGVAASTVSTEEARQLHPLLELSDVAAIGYESESGYADPNLTTTAFIRAARKRGATIEEGVAVEAIACEHGVAKGVQTANGVIYADKVVLAVGPWTQDLVRAIGFTLPLEISAHTVMTFRAPDTHYGKYPVVKDLTTPNKMYFRQEAGGVVLVGSGDFGETITSADDTRTLDDLLVATQGDQLAKRMPTFVHASMTNSWSGPYDITPDWNPVIDVAPGVEGLYLTFGFSGHGFKLAPMIGKLLAKTLVDDEVPDLLEPYRLDRFERGLLLVGAYGDGSIS